MALARGAHDGPPQLQWRDLPTPATVAPPPAAANALKPRCRQSRAGSDSRCPIPGVLRRAGTDPPPPVATRSGGAHAPPIKGWNSGSGMSRETPMTVGVVIATLGRPREAAQVLERLRDQTLAPARIVFSVEKMADLPPQLAAGQLGPDVEVVLGARGLCAQRNRGMTRVLETCDVVAFYDDDFLPSRRSLEGMAELFAGHADVVGATGHVLADGVTRGGLPWEQAREIVEAYDDAPDLPPWNVADLGWAYGCNMAFRCRAATGLRFDERLPLYGWQEDVDFAGQIARRGRVVRTNAFAGVHVGVTKSRSPGVRLGFSQVVNPVYLVRKGTMRSGHAARIMGRNLLANHLRALAPEPYIDRRGRLIGNWFGVLHLLAGRLEPERIWSLP